MKINKFLFLFGIVISAFLVFHSLLFSGTAVWGDAPYFYPEGLNQLFSEPLVWISRGINFGGINNLLWLSPIMFLYGTLNKLLNFNNDLIIRIVFYAPAIIAAFSSPWLFARYLKVSLVAQFFTCLVYGINTYFILLIDGGQVGVALAYGLFPLGVWSLRSFIDKPNIRSFYIALVSIFAVELVDVRFVIITLLSITVWYFLDVLFDNSKFSLKVCIQLTLLVVLEMLLGAYWLYPLMAIGKEFTPIGISDLQLNSLLNSFLLYQPHWPNNEFGKVTTPPFYFALMPLLIFGGMYFKRTKQTTVFVMIVLMFAFLTKGTTPPFGNVYEWLINKIPYGTSLRDSTKFFTPLILFSGVLIGQTIENISGKFKVFPLKWGVIIFAVCYLILLVFPSVSNNLHGTLSPHYVSSDFTEIYSIETKDNAFSRSLWFPEHSPYTYESEIHPALDAKDLVDARPFASLNTGVLDKYNFFHDQLSLDWLRLLGIKYIGLSGDFRKLNLNNEEKKDWEDLLSLVSSLPGLKKIEQISFPFYKVENTQPHIYTTDKIMAVIGGDDIYEKIKDEDKNFNLSNQGFVFFEDGNFDPRSLQGAAPDSLMIVFNDKEMDDLTYSYLQKFFTSSTEIVHSDWAVRKPFEYLQWKYELLTKGITTKEFDYNKGILFSTNQDEKIVYKLKVPRDGIYTLGVRSMGDSDNSIILTNFNNQDFEIHPKFNKFSWFTKENIQLKNGDYTISFKNPGGVKVLNTVGLIPKGDWDNAKYLSQELTKYYKVFDTSGNQRIGDESTSKGKWSPVDVSNTGTLQYEFTLPAQSWLVFTDTYNPFWELKKGNNIFHSLPLYSMVNGFYTDKGGKNTLYFNGQENFRWGMYITTLTGLILAMNYFWQTRGKR